MEYFDRGKAFVWKLMLAFSQSTTSACSESNDGASPEQEAKGDVKFTYSIRWVPRCVLVQLHHISCVGLGLDGNIRCSE